MIMNWLFYFLRNLPHGLYTADTDVCLFVKDLDKKSREFEVSEEHFSDMLVEKGVNCVRKVITSTEVYISGVWLSVISTLSTTVIRSVKRWIYVNWLKGLSVKKSEISVVRTLTSWHGKSWFQDPVGFDSLSPGTHAKIGSSLKNMSDVDEICTLYTIQI